MISLLIFFFYNDWISQSNLLFTQGLVVLADSATLISGLPHNCFFFSFFLDSQLVMWRVTTRGSGQVPVCAH